MTMIQVGTTGMTRTFSGRSGWSDSPSPGFQVSSGLPGCEPQAEVRRQGRSGCCKPEPDSESVEFLTAGAPAVILKRQCQSLHPEAVPGLVYVCVLLPVVPDSDSLPSLYCSHGRHGHGCSMSFMIVVL